MATSTATRRLLVSVALNPTTTATTVTLRTRPTTRFFHRTSSRTPAAPAPSASGRALTRLPLQNSKPKTPPNTGINPTNPDHTPDTSAPNTVILTPKEIPPPGLAGTIITHTLYVLLHTSHSPQSYPSRKGSKLQRALQVRMSRWGGVVNFGYREDLEMSSPADEPVKEGEGEGGRRWWERWTRRGRTGEGESEVVVDGEGKGEAQEGEERCRATAYSMNRGILHIPLVTLDNIEHVEETLRLHASPPSPSSTTSPTTSSSSHNDIDVKQPISQEQDSEEIHLYICTHGARDCRCGTQGGALLSLLHGEVKRRGLGDRVKVGEVGHIGGHKWAPNMLVYPHGEWLGLIDPQTLPSLLDRILALPTRAMLPTEPPISIGNWRGRQGMNKDEMMALVSRFSGGEGSDSG